MIIVYLSRYFLGSLSVAGMFGVNRTDTVYTCLPLYHSSGGVLGVAAALSFGVKTVIRKKFSARNYFKDCAKYNVTVSTFLYYHVSTKLIISCGNYRLLVTLVKPAGT